MNDSDWLDSNAALLGIGVAPEWREAVLLHLRITPLCSACLIHTIPPYERDCKPSHTRRWR